MLAEDGDSTLKYLLWHQHYTGLNPDLNPNQDMDSHITDAKETFPTEESMCIESYP